MPYPCPCCMYHAYLRTSYHIHLVCFWLPSHHHRTFSWESAHFHCACFWLHLISILHASSSCLVAIRSPFEHLLGMISLRPEPPLAFPSSSWPLFLASSSCDNHGHCFHFHGFWFLGALQQIFAQQRVLIPAPDALVNQRAFCSCFARLSLTSASCDNRHRCFHFYGFWLSGALQHILARQHVLFPAPFLSGWPAWFLLSLSPAFSSASRRQVTSWFLLLL